MMDIDAQVALGTAAAMLAMGLLLLRVQIGDRRPALRFARAWAATGSAYATACIVPLGAIAVISLATLPPRGAPPSDTATGTVELVPGAAQDVEALRTYVARIDGHPGASAGPSPTGKEATAASVPDVDVMIAKLEARLKEAPGDVKGWKMLGWSYLNTGRPKDAEAAYAKAQTLAPGDEEIGKGLDAAKAANTVR